MISQVKNESRGQVAAGWYRLPFAALLLALAACTGGNAPSNAPAADAAKPAESAIGFKPVATNQDIMDGQVMPSADILWNATAVTSDATGVHEGGPKNDDDWKKLRYSAIQLIEATNLLMMEGRSVSKTDFPADANAQSLSSKEIAALIAKNREAFKGFAAELREVGVSMLKTIDERKLAPLSDLGGQLDEVCESCHKMFWYPPPAANAETAPQAETAPAKG
jgi:hypothetical protein